VCAGWKFPKYRYEISRFKGKRQTSDDILVSAIFSKAQVAQLILEIVFVFLFRNKHSAIRLILSVF
jgi:hypothetical protein